MEYGQDTDAVIVPDEGRGLKARSGDSALAGKVPNPYTDEDVEDEMHDDRGADDSGTEEDMSVEGSTDTSPSGCYGHDLADEEPVPAVADESSPKAAGKGASKGSGDKSRRKATGEEAPATTACTKRRKTNRRRRKQAEQGAEQATGFTCERCFRSKVKCDRGTPCSRCVRLKLCCEPRLVRPGRPRKASTDETPHPPTANKESKDNNKKEQGGGKSKKSHKKKREHSQPPSTTSGSGSDPAKGEGAHACKKRRTYNSSVASAFADAIKPPPPVEKRPPKKDKPTTTSSSSNSNSSSSSAPSKASKSTKPDAPPTAPTATSKAKKKSTAPSAPAVPPPPTRGPPVRRRNERPSSPSPCSSRSATTSPTTATATAKDESTEPDDTKKPPTPQPPTATATAAARPHKALFIQAPCEEEEEEDEEDPSKWWGLPDPLPISHLPPPLHPDSLHSHANNNNDADANNGPLSIGSTGSRSLCVSPTLLEASCLWELLGPPQPPTLLGGPTCASSSWGNPVSMSSLTASTGSNSNSVSGCSSTSFTSLSSVPSTSTKTAPSDASTSTSTPYSPHPHDPHAVVISLCRPLVSFTQGGVAACSRTQDAPFRPPSSSSSSPNSPVTQPFPTYAHPSLSSLLPLPPTVSPPFPAPLKTEARPGPLSHVPTLHKWLGQHQQSLLKAHHTSTSPTKATAVLLSWHWSNLLLGRDSTEDLLPTLAQALLPSPLPHVLPPLPTHSHDNGMRDRLNRLFEVSSPDKAMCCVSWSVGRLHVLASERFVSVFMSRSDMEEGLVVEGKAPMHLWARLVESGECVGSYWDVMLQAALLPSPPSPTHLDSDLDMPTSQKCLKVRDRFGLVSWATARVAIEASPCGWHSFALLILEPMLT